MKYFIILMTAILAMSADAGMAPKVDIERMVLKELLDEDHISQFEYIRKMAALKVHERMGQELQSKPNTGVSRSGPPGTASVSGTVRVGGIGQIGVNVHVRDLSTGAYFGSATTNGIGAYTIPGLAAGDYYLTADENYDDYINAMWSSSGTEQCTYCQPDADNAFSLADAEIRINTDLDMVVGATVSGNISEGLNNLDSQFVSIRTTDYQYSLGDSTDASGNYSFTGLPAGDYYVLSADYSDDYIDAMWSSLGTVQCSQCIPDVNSTLSLVVGEVRVGVDLSLTIGAILTGQILDSVSSVPVETLRVNLFSTTDPTEYWYFYTEYDGLGNYTVRGIPQGNYKVYLEPDSSVSNEYVPKIYNNIPCNLCSTMVFNGAGDVVAMTNGVNTGGINFGLQKGASVAGSIVNGAYPAETLEEFALIYLFNETNRVVTSQFLYGTNNDPMFTGDYKIGGLLPGTYFAQGGDLGREFFQRELYDDIRCPWSGCDRGAGGVPIVLGATEQRTGIDFNLEYGGKISGTVTDMVTGDPISSPLETQYVQFYDAAGLVAGGADIFADGTYLSRRALPPGTYSVRTGTMFNAVFNTPYVMEKYDSSGNIDCPGVTCDLTAGNVVVPNYVRQMPRDPVAEAAAATVTGIDFALSTAFSFSGTITEIGSPNPIPDVHVLVFDDNGDFANWATTDAMGDFTVSGLPAGTYYALTNNGSNLPFMGFYPEEVGGWIDILFDGTPCPGSACDVTTGDPIVLGGAPGIEGSTDPFLDFSLSAGGTLTGQVSTFGSLLPARYVNINVYNSAGLFYGSYPTDSSGYYLTVGLPEGTYYLTTSNDGALVNAKYGGDYCFVESCDPLDAVPVVITGNESLTGIDFELRPDYIFKYGMD